MPTIKDVAKKAGVSTATVSYYLNHKPVSEEKASRIAAAIRELNYVIQSPGRDLRTRKNRTIGIVFPNISDPYYQKIIQSVKLFLAQHNRLFSLILSDNDPDYENQILQDFIGRKCAGILLYSCQPHRPEVFAMLESSGIPFVLIDRKPEDSHYNYVGCDNYSLFYELTLNCCRRKRAEPLLICGSSVYPEHQAACEGFTEAAHSLKYSKPRIIFSDSLSREEGFRIGMQLCKTLYRPSILLSTSFLLAEGLLYAMRLNHVNLDRDIFLATAGDCEDDVFYSNPLIYKTSRPAFRIGETAARLLLDNIHAPQDFVCKSLTILNEPDACEIPEKSPSSAPAVIKSCDQLNVLTTDGYQLKSLVADFYAREHITIKTTDVPSEELYHIIDRELARKSSSYDIISFDMPYIADFVRRGYLLPLDFREDSFQADAGEYVPGVLNPACRFYGHYYALPYLASTQLLFYRKDFFTEENICRQYEKQYQIPLSVPINWQQYNQLSQFFTRSVNPHSPSLYGNALNFYYSSLAVCAFWNRLFASPNHPVHPITRQLELTSPIAVQSLRQLLESIPFSFPNIRLYPMDCIRKLIRGEVSMVVTFFNHATEIRYPSLFGKIGYAQIPGGAPVLGGWVHGINRYSAHPEEALRYIKWASSDRLAVPQAILGGHSPHLNAYHDYNLLSHYPWLSVALQAFQLARTRQFVTSSHSRNLSSRDVEYKLASEICLLADQAAAGHMPDDGALLRALSRIESDLAEP